MSKSRLTLKASLGLFAMLLVAGGCSDAHKQRWNSFWGLDQGSQKPIVKGEDTPSQPAPVAENRPAAQPESNDAGGPGDLQNRIDQYVSNMPSKRKAGYEPNDHMSKIRRQQDPNRRARVQAAADRRPAEPESAPPPRVRGPEISTLVNNEPVRPAGDADHITMTDMNAQPSPVSNETSTPEPVTHESITHTPITHEPITHEPVTTHEPASPGQPLSHETIPIETIASGPSDPMNDTGMSGPADAGEIPANRSTAFNAFPDETNRTGVPHTVDSSMVEPLPSSTIDQPVAGSVGSADETGSTYSHEITPIDIGTGSHDITMQDPAQPSDVTQPVAAPAEDSSAQPITNDPPVLTRVDVSAGSDTPISTPKDLSEMRGRPEPAQPDPIQPVTMKAKASGQQTRMQELEATVAKDPNNQQNQLVLRMMYAMEGMDEKALAPLQGANAEIEEIVHAQVKAFIAARSGSGRDPAEWANKQLEPVKQLEESVRAKADLQVPKVVLCKAIERFGKYTAFDPPEFAAGRKHAVLIYIEVENWTSEKTDNGRHRTLLSVRYSVLDKSGREVFSKRDENIEDLAEEPRRDFYLTTPPTTIPPSLPAGEYTVKAEVEDVLAGKINSGTMKFRIK